MSADFSFAWPAVFLLLPLPWLALQFLRPLPPRRLLRLPTLAAYPALPAAQGTRAPWLAWFAWCLLVIAAARPQLPDTDAPLPVSGRSLMLAFDLSASMATRDLALDGRPVERLAAARQLAREFIARRGGDRVGLIVFGKQAYVHVPPTFDLAAVAAALDDATPGLAGNETALGDAIALATKQLRAQPEPARVLVLLTDGANTAGALDPQRAAWLAQREGMRIHTVGIGTATGRNSAFDLDAATLQALAAQTGGLYQHAGDAPALAEFFHTLDALEPLPDRNAALRPARELLAWPLGAALLATATLLLRRRRAASADFLPQAVDTHLLPHLLVTRAPAAGTHALGLALASLALLAFIAAWLRPAAPAGPFRAAALRVLVADLSAPHSDGLLRARLVELLDQLPPGETALIVYAGDAYLAVPPTSDPRNIAALAPELAAAIMPLPGHRPERAWQLAQEVLARHPGRQGQVVWLTTQAASVPLQPDVLLLDIDAASAAGDSAAIVARLAASGRWQLERLGETLPPVGILLLALLPLAALGFRRGLIAVAAVLPAPTFLLALLLAPTDASADDGRWQAVAHYRAGRYEEALRLLDGHGDAVSHYNRGNALARLGRYAEAEAAFTAALALRPDDADAQFNRELMRRLRNPPPPPPTGQGKPPPPASAPPAAAEAARVAEQWLQGVPDDPGGLLRAKLRREQARRTGGAP